MSYSFLTTEVLRTRKGSKATTLKIITITGFVILMKTDTVFCVHVLRACVFLK